MTNGVTHCKPPPRPNVAVFAPKGVGQEQTSGPLLAVSGMLELPDGEGGWKPATVTRYEVDGTPVQLFACTPELCGDTLEQFLGLRDREHEAIAKVGPPFSMEPDDISSVLKGFVEGVDKYTAIELEDLLRVNWVASLSNVDELGEPIVLLDMFEGLYECIMDFSRAFACRGARVVFCVEAISDGRGDPRRRAAREAARGAGMFTTADWQAPMMPTTATATWTTTTL